MNDEAIELLAGPTTRPRSVSPGQVRSGGSGQESSPRASATARGFLADDLSLPPSPTATLMMANKTGLLVWSGSVWWHAAKIKRKHTFCTYAIMTCVLDGTCLATKTCEDALIAMVSIA